MTPPAEGGPAFPWQRLADLQTCAKRAETPPLTQVPPADIAAVLAKLTPTDRQGLLGNGSLSLARMQRLGLVDFHQVVRLSGRRVAAGEEASLTNLGLAVQRQLRADARAEKKSA